MPKSKGPKKPYNGNKFTLTSREFRILNERINDVLGQVRTTQIALLSLTQALKTDAAVPTEVEVEALANEAMTETLQELAAEAATAETPL